MKKLVRTAILAAVIFGMSTLTLGLSLFTALSAVLTAATLVFVRDSIRTESRLSSILIIGGMYWGLSYASNLIEAVYFMVVPLTAALSAAMVGLVTTLVVAGLLEILTPQAIERPLHPAALAFGAWWRIPALAFVFFCTYLAAGIAVHPWIAAFYAHLRLPTLPQLLRLQLCRGLLDIACVYPVYRTWAKSRYVAAWVSACVFTVLCGWGPLLLPNRFMPGSLRLFHAAEMGASGIVFGVIVPVVLLKPTARQVGSRPERGAHTFGAGERPDLQ